MVFKILKKLVGLFGFKLVSKNLIKNNRILESSGILSLDKILNDIFRANKITGLVQIGANDGLRFDVLNRFIKKYKPKSILVEPINDYFEELKKNYKGFNNVILENFAISVNNEISHLYKVNSKFINKYDEHIKGISSFEINHLTKHGVKEITSSKKKVSCIPISELFKKYNFEINLLVIDAEGYDAEITLNLLENTNFRPIIIFEYIHTRFSSLKKLKNLFDKKNYKYFKVNENLFCFPAEMSFDLKF